MTLISALTKSEGTLFLKKVTIPLLVMIVLAILYHHKNAFLHRQIGEKSSFTYGHLFFTLNSALITLIGLQAIYKIFKNLNKQIAIYQNGEQQSKEKIRELEEENRQQKVLLDQQELQVKELTQQASVTHQKAEQQIKLEEQEKEQLAAQQKAEQQEKEIAQKKADQTKKAKDEAKWKTKCELNNKAVAKKEAKKREESQLRQRDPLFIEYTQTRLCFPPSSLVSYDGESFLQIRERRQNELLKAHLLPELTKIICDFLGNDPIIDINFEKYKNFVLKGMFLEIDRELAFDPPYWPNYWVGDLNNMTRDGIIDWITYELPHLRDAREYLTYFCLPTPLNSMKKYDITVSHIIKKSFLKMFIELERQGNSTSLKMEKEIYNLLVQNLNPKINILPWGTTDKSYSLKFTDLMIIAALFSSLYFGHIKPRGIK